MTAHCPDCRQEIPDVCPTCKGSGQRMGYDLVGPLGYEPCGRCHGDGKYHAIKPNIGGYQGGYDV